MPTYESKCHKCGSMHQYIRKIADYQNTPVCCGEKTTKTLTIGSIPMIDRVSARVMDAYECPVTEQVVTSAKQKKYIEDKNDLIIKEPGIVKNPVNNRAPGEKLPDELVPELEKELAVMNS